VRFDDITIVTPDTSNFVIEAEDMFLSGGYSVESGLGRIVIADTGNATGYAARTFAGPSGLYDVNVQLVSDGTGLSVVELYLNDNRLGYEYFDYSPENRLLSVAAVQLSPGDLLVLAGNTEGDAARASTRSC
jgi:hypothetical protein